MPRKLIETKIIAGEAIHVDQNQIVPITRSICVRPFGFQVGLVWNRPIAAMVLEQDGTERVVPIRDVTRQLQIIFISVGLIGSLLLWGIQKVANSR